MQNQVASAQTEPVHGSGVAKNGHARHRRAESGPMRDPYAAFISNWRLSGDERLGICSCQRSGGSSLIAASIAISSAAVLDLRTLLIDANLYHPSLHRTFRVQPHPGLADTLSMRAEPLDVIQSTRVSRLSIMSAGSLRHTRWSDFSADQMEALFAELRGDFDLVVVDLPSAQEMSEGVNVGSSLDGVLLVVESERTSTMAALHAKKQLVQTGSKVVGSVLNKTRRHLPRWLDNWLSN